jgi:hypothetical protein
MAGGIRYGAGRPGWHVKAEHCLRLDVRDMARHKLLAGGTYGCTWRWTNTATGESSGSISLWVTADAMRLKFTTNELPAQQHVPIDRTACNYGGTRPWFRCPRCDARVAVLYLRGGRFICRRCGSVAYGSQSDDTFGRIWRRQYKLERRLGDNWARPKRMHRRTHERLFDAICECEQARDSALEIALARWGLVV